MGIHKTVIDKSAIEIDMEEQTIEIGPHYSSTQRSQAMPICFTFEEFENIVYYIETIRNAFPANDKPKPEDDKSEEESIDKEDSTA